MLNSSVHYQNASCIYLGNLSAAAIWHCSCARTLFEMKLAFPRSLKIYFSTIQLKQRSASWLSRRIEIPDFCGRAPWPQTYRILHFWAADSAEYLRLSSVENIEHWLHGRPASFLRVCMVSKKECKNDEFSGAVSVSVDRRVKEGGTVLSRLSSMYGSN